MRHGSIIGLISVLTFASVCHSVAWPSTRGQSYRDIQKKLSTMVSLRLNQDKLASLFEVGDRRILDLIQALDDPDTRISLNAQVVIRYLGNDQGMKALYEWYKKQQREYKVGGPVPVPLSEWDYNYIKLNCVDEPVRTWSDREMQYIYALALDGSPRATGVLIQLVDKARVAAESSSVSQVIKSVTNGNPNRLFGNDKDLAAAVLKNAFFIPANDQKHASASVLAFNATKSKALVEVQIDRGDLSQVWYHVVITRQRGQWAFFSVYQVGIS